jgi:hypothetical protein
VAERARDLPIFIPGSAPGNSAAWQLQGATGEGALWETVNAGPPDAPIRGRFFTDHTVYRILIVHESGAVTPGPPKPIPGKR